MCYWHGGIDGWTTIGICRLLCILLDGHKPENSPHEKFIIFVQDRAGHDWCYAINAAKMSNELSRQPSELFETGIRKTVEWYLA
ncbi:MAG: hypothetical protein R8K22_03680 [Mariprofundaceae bacterium]